MQRFKNILVVTEKDDGQEVAFHHAVTLAANNGAQLTILDLLDEIPEQQTRLLGKLFSRELDEVIVKNRLNYLETLIEPVRQEVRVKIQTVKGTPFIEIIRAVLKGKYDLVIKTSKARRSLKTLLFGSTDMHLLRKCPCPVCIIKPGQDRKFQRILAAVDIEPSSDDEKMDALNQQLLEMATGLAFSESSELHIVHAWLVFGKKMQETSRFDSQKEKIETWMKAQRNDLEIRQDEFKIKLDELLAQRGMDSLHPEIHMVEGIADDVIPHIVQEKQVDLVVMGTLGRTGLSGFFMGNTAENILSQINCSVLALKPSGFVSPVIVDL